jgi:CheY-like chemotaxis protein
MILITTLIRQMVPNVEILEATNGQEALDLFIIGKPELIFMDIQMPEMDGIEATMEIRRLEKGNGRIPIVALTAGSIKGEEEKCMNAGMDSFLTKPIVQKELVKVLEKYLSLVTVQHKPN